ncbi:hypothetical protein CKM354_000108300 [Cercospora kikuchii]|uniref:Uncharacterized protein n=1 Tax=Cercospora kikuchii TaxID=84275 RepID=A0A9P3CA43_9PEZI|nr:uncharacterized protein CKM354_000108300 [Cercospora kikuchii]GIZ37641.1 hypothetical protein CKM354_000108300 [Cercospora kikuchii]
MAYEQTPRNPAPVSGMVFEFSNNVPGRASAPLEQSRQGIDEYRRIMHAYMQSQLNRGTIPGYQRIMHAHTMVQLEAMKTARSEAGSPVLAQAGAILPSPIKAHRSQTTIDNAPIPPNNSPAPGSQSAFRTPNGMRTRQRSLTDPMPRDFAALRASVACG